jgi:hypothetical protein
MFGEIWNPRLGEHKLKESGPDSVEYHVKGAYLRSQKPFARDVDPSYDFEVLFEVDGTPIKEAIERAGLNVEDLLRQPPPPPNDEGEEDAPEEEETWEEVKDGDAPPPPPPPGLQFTSSATARKQGLKPPEFLVDGLLPLNSVTLLTGAGAVGKSMLSQLLGSCVAIGAPFLGRATTPGKVIALYSEDETDELGRRQAAIEDHIKVEVPDGDFVWLDADAIAERQSGIALMSFDRNGNPKLTPFFKLVEAAIIAHTPRLLIIDHAASAFLGHSMMQVQVQAFMGALVRLCRKHSCNIVLLAHPSLSSIQERRASGTLQWENTVRSQLSMDYVRGKEGRQLKEVPRRELTLTKANRGNQGWTTTIEWHPYGNSGLFDLPPNPFDGPYDEAAECDRRFMQAVRGRLAREGRERVLNRNVTGPYFAPRLIAEEVGRSVDQMEAAMQRAFDAELIHLVEGVKKQPDHIELGPAPVATDA